MQVADKHANYVKLNTAVHCYARNRDSWLQPQWGAERDLGCSFSSCWCCSCWRSS
jgi:hypothetical protein